MTNVGNWWGNQIIITDKKIVQPTDIDIVGISHIEKKYLVGECKFKNEKIDKSILDTLKERAKLLSTKYTLTKYVLFSLSGFTDYFSLNKNDDVICISLDDMYN